MALLRLFREKAVQEIAAGPGHVLGIGSYDCRTRPERTTVEERAPQDLDPHVRRRGSGGVQ
jgi:hypothetical protein